MGSSMMLTLGFAVAVIGAVLVANAVRAPQVDAEAVLAELDTEPLVLDEFTTRLREPIVTRLLRPLAEDLVDAFGVPAEMLHAELLTPLQEA